MDYVVFGENVRKYRKIANMTQESLAEMCDCSIGHIGHIENGNNKPSLDIAVKIANSLGVTIDQLMVENYLYPEKVYLNEVAEIINTFPVKERVVVCESIKNVVESMNYIIQSKKKIRGINYVEEMLLTEK